MENKNFTVEVKAIITYNNKILLLQHNNAEDWDFPKGLLNFGETLEEAVARVVKETCNIDVRINMLVYATSNVINSSSQQVSQSYLCSGVSPNIKLTSKYANYCWANRIRMEDIVNNNTLDNFYDFNVFDYMALD